MRAIQACRTSVLGGHVDECLDCGLERPAYNSCRNRNCPKCQALAQQRWVDKRKERILPVHYFHVVFTLPAELKLLVLRNRRLLYDLLFMAAAETLLILGRDPKRLGCLLGISAVLHTWTRDLRFHPHLHCIVTGGGLSTDSNKWVDTGGKYLFPVKVLSMLFRGKFLDALSRAYEDGKLKLPDNLSAPGAFATLRDRLFEKGWVVYSKRPFAGPEQVFSYLGRYTHRVGISNHRLLSVTDNSVTIDTRDGKTATMHPQEFIRRFLLHVLPAGFVKIRHYGLMASSNVKTKLALASRLLELRPSNRKKKNSEHAAAEDWRTLFERLTGINLRICPRCGSSRIRRIPLARSIANYNTARSPP